MALMALSVTAESAQLTLGLDLSMYTHGVCKCSGKYVDHVTLLINTVYIYIYFYLVIYLFVYLFICLFICLFIYVCMCMCMHACMYQYIRHIVPICMHEYVKGETCCAYSLVG